jgi:hypothetical protein
MLLASLRHDVEYRDKYFYGFRNSSGSLAIFAAIRRAKQPGLLDGDVSYLDTCSEFLNVMLR